MLVVHDTAGVAECLWAARVIFISSCVYGWVYRYTQSRVHIRVMYISCLCKHICTPKYHLSLRIGKCGVNNYDRQST